MEDQVGLVACGIFGPSHPAIIVTSETAGPGKWLHAERNAIEQCETRFGRIDPGSLLVVTLSPCTRQEFTSRHGAPCAELIQGRGISRVHTGVIDPKQAPTGLAEYTSRGIDLSVTTDDRCRTICARLLGVFQKYGNRVNSDLINIKREIDFDIFETHGLSV